jgi:hypothetical protein
VRDKSAVKYTSAEFWRGDEEQPSTVDQALIDDMQDQMSKYFTQNTPGVPDTAGYDERFGSASVTRWPLSRARSGQIGSTVQAPNGVRHTAPPREAGYLRDIQQRHRSVPLRFGSHKGNGEQ